MNHGTVSAEIAAGLLALHERIAAANIPSSKLDESINIATWNIREFGKKSRTLPLWMQMNTDIEGFKLEQIIQHHNV